MAPPGPTWLILPTYNERENVESFVEAVRVQLAECVPDYRVLIVDDASPDGTGQLADQLAAKYNDVEVLHRPRKEGLGQAYIAGFKVALAGGAELLIEMDSDFSHKPDYLQPLIAATAHADLTLGSRYIPGGGVTDWGPVRRLISRGGSWYARRWLNVPVRDLTGGFKCFRRAVLEEIDLNSVRSQGYTFQIELTYRALQAGFKVREIPIVFEDRRAGESKMNKRIVLEAVLLVPRLRFAGRHKVGDLGR